MNNQEKIFAELLQSKIEAQNADATEQNWQKMNAILDKSYQPEPLFFEQTMPNKISEVQHPMPQTHWQNMNDKIDQQNNAIYVKLSNLHHEPTEKAWHQMSQLLDAAFMPEMPKALTMRSLKKYILTAFAVLFCFGYAPNVHKKSLFASQAKRYDLLDIRKPNAPKSNVAKPSIANSNTAKTELYAQAISGKMVDNSKVLRHSQAENGYLAANDVSETRRTNDPNAAHNDLKTNGLVKNNTDMLTDKSVNTNQSQIAAVEEPIKNTFAAMETPRVKIEQLQSPTMPKKGIKLNPNIYFGVRAAAVYNAAYNYNTKKYEASLSPSFGAFLGGDISPKLGLETGIEYKNISPKSLYRAEIMQVNSNPSNYRAVKNTFAVDKMHFIEVPLVVSYQVTAKSAAQAGIKASYLFGSRMVTATDTIDIDAGGNITLPTQTAKILNVQYDAQNEYLQKVNFQLLASYEIRQSQSLATGVRFAKSFRNMYDGSYFNSNVFYRNTDVQVYVKYRLR